MFVFLDIPQTGGTTFATIFERQFPEQAVRHFPGGISNEDWDEFITSREVDNYTALMGCIEYSKVEKIPAPCTCITMIRHPVARAVSEYRFVISHEDNPFHEACKSMSLLEYVSSKYYPGNLQSGYLCGTDLPDPPPQDAVELWNEHIRITERYIEEHIDFVGITERFEESLALLHMFYGWSPMFYGRSHMFYGWSALDYVPENISAVKSDEIEVTEEAKNVILQRTDIDMHVYEHFSRKFDEMIKRYEYFPSVLSEIKSRGDTKSNPMFVFLHIPKTGGVTLGTIFQKQFPKQAVRHFTMEVNDDDWDEFITSGELQKYTALLGHIEYKHVRDIPNPCTYITMIRHPVERAISEYKHYLSHEDYEFYTAVKSMTFFDYVSSEYHRCNLQSRFLCGIDPPPPNAVAIIEENIDFVGITERFDESLALLCMFYSWHSLYYVTENVSKVKRDEIEVTDEAINVISAKNEIDMKVYEHFSKKFDDITRRFEYFPSVLSDVLSSVEE